VRRTLVACVVRRSWLGSALPSVWRFAVFRGLSACGSVDPKILALSDQSGVYLYVSMTVALSVAEVVAAFLLVWGIRRLIFSWRKKAS